MGSALEYYDFYIYGLASALIFGPLFFKPLGEDGALIASFATYGVGFAARPFGGMIFGYIGDRFGRKMVLILTIGLMGTASFAIGLLPTFEQAGMVGAVLLVTLRILQGLGAGAEQAGATTLISEVAPRRRRGFFAALPFVGIQLGTLLGAGTFALIAMSDKATLEGWLWRVPFLSSVILIALAIFIRLRLKETPVFQELEKHKNVAKNPLGQLWKHSKKNTLIGIGLRMGENGNSSIYSALLIAFLAAKDGVFPGDKFIGPVGLLIAAGFAAVMVVTFGALSDRFGRVPVYRYGALFQALIALPAFYLVTPGQCHACLDRHGGGHCPRRPVHARPAVPAAARTLRFAVPVHRRGHEPRTLCRDGRRAGSAGGRRAPGGHGSLLAGARHLLAGACPDLICHDVLHPRDGGTRPPPDGGRQLAAWFVARCGGPKAVAPPQRRGRGLPASRGCVMGKCWRRAEYLATRGIPGDARLPRRQASCESRAT